MNGKIQNGVRNEEEEELIEGISDLDSSRGTMILKFI